MLIDLKIKWMSIFEWFVVRCECKNAHQTTCVGTRLDNVLKKQFGKF